VPAGPLPAPPLPRVSSGALLGSGREVEILHGTQLYRLRLTSLGKLILTK
jgi:hemin uptake protein HemP